LATTISNKKEIEMELKLNSRGFHVVEFEDAQGNLCFVQDSAPHHRTDLVWFGVDTTECGLAGVCTYLTRDMVRSMLNVVVSISEDLNGPRSIEFLSVGDHLVAVCADSDAQPGTVRVLLLQHGLPCKMHLSRECVAELRPFLESFIEHGTISKPKVAAVVDLTSWKEQVRSKIDETRNTAMDHLQQRLGELTVLIAKHDRKYFVDMSPDISDEEYDALVQERDLLIKKLGEQDAAGSVDETVGHPVTDRKTAHAVKMLSLNKVHSLDDLRKFLTNIQTKFGDVMFSMEYKVDGVALEIQYKAGCPMKAITRGDGICGEDVSHVLPYLDIEETLNPMFDTVHGEVYVAKKDLADINEARLMDAEDPIATCRAAAAGALKLQSISEIARRRLHFVPYSTFTSSGKPESVYSTALLSMTSDVDRLVDAAQQFTKYSGESFSHFPIDGLVFKAMPPEVRAELGESRKAPKWAIAYKLPIKAATTRLINVVPYTTRSGLISPVAWFEEVTLQGTKVSRASLNNYDRVTKELMLREHDTIEVGLAGAVIPKLLRRVEDDENPNPGSPILPPTNCQSCGSALVGSGATLRCPAQYSCDAQVAAKLAHFVSRPCADIEGIGPATVLKLLAFGITTPDLLYSKCDEFVAANSAEDAGEMWRIKAAIDARRTLPTSRLLLGLGMPSIGAVAASQIARQYGTADVIDHIVKRSEFDPVLHPLLVPIREFVTNPYTSGVWTRLLNEITTTKG
jgi:DNA ligase (NAD+)